MLILLWFSFLQQIHFILTLVNIKTLRNHWLIRHQKFHATIMEYFFCISDSLRLSIDLLCLLIFTFFKWYIACGIPWPLIQRLLPSMLSRYLSSACPILLIPLILNWSWDSWYSLILIFRLLNSLYIRNKLQDNN